MLIFPYKGFRFRVFRQRRISNAAEARGLIEKEILKKRISKYGKKEEWILLFEKKLDRINKIVRIERPSAEESLAAGEKIPSIL